MSIRCEAIIKGDDKVQAISAASILAKTARDAALEVLHQQFPQYAFDQHKGYPTALHLARLREHGVSPVHRKSYAPVRALLHERMMNSHETDFFARQSALQRAQATGDQFASPAPGAAHAARWRAFVRSLSGAGRPAAAVRRQR